MSDIEPIRAAAIANGIVVNVEMILPDFERDGVLFVPSDTAGIGDRYDGGIFIRPVFTPPPLKAGEVVTYKADVWRRASADQAAVIDTEIDKLEPRLRRLWEDSSYLDHIEPEVAFFKKMLADTFGQAEADRIMAPSPAQA